MKRAFAGVLMGLIVGLAGYVAYQHVEAAPTCDACHREIHDETLYRVYLQDGSQAQVCCPRCGIRYERERGDVTHSDVADFRTRRRIDAGSAYYVEDSSVVMCRHDNRLKEDLTGGQYALTYDRCLPSLVAFETREAAEAFQRDEGGAIKTYAEIRAEDF